MKGIEVEWTDLATDDDSTEVLRAAVNNSGEGLFFADRDGYRQALGNGQFHASSPRDMTRKLRRIYEGQMVRMVRGSAWGWD